MCQVGELNLHVVHEALCELLSGFDRGLLSRQTADPDLCIGEDLSTGSGNHLASHFNNGLGHAIVRLLTLLDLDQERDICVVFEGHLSGGLTHLVYVHQVRSLRAQL